MAARTAMVLNALDKIAERYRYLGLILDSISYSPDVQTASHILTLHYKDGSYELIRLDDIKDIHSILEQKNLELQPQRGDRASKYHV